MRVREPPDVVGISAGAGVNRLGTECSRHDMETADSSPLTSVISKSCVLGGLVAKVDFVVVVDLVAAAGDDFAVVAESSPTAATRSTKSLRFLSNFFIRHDTIINKQFATDNSDQYVVSDQHTQVMYRV